MFHDSRKTEFLAGAWHLGFTALYYHKYRTAENLFEKLLYGGALLFHLGSTVEHIRCGRKVS